MTADAYADMTLEEMHAQMARLQTQRRGAAGGHDAGVGNPRRHGPADGADPAAHDAGGSP